MEDALVIADGTEADWCRPEVDVVVEQRSDADKDLMATLMRNGLSRRKARMIADATLKGF